jgi:hypothetical protein
MQQAPGDPTGNPGRIDCPAGSEVPRFGALEALERRILVPDEKRHLRTALEEQGAFEIVGR